MKDYFKELKAPVIYAGAAILLLSAYNYWQEQHMRTPKQSDKPVNLNRHVDENGHLIMGNDVAHKSHPTVDVVTDNLLVTIDLIGGSIVKASLPNYTKSLADKSPVSVLQDQAQDFHIAEFGVVGDYNVRYSLASEGLRLLPGKNQLDVVLKGKNKQGIEFIKTLQFTRGNYYINLKTTVKNDSKAAWSGHFYQQLKRSEPVVEQGIGRRTYHGMSFYQDKKPYTKLDYSDMRKHDLSTDVKGGWIAGQQHYFLAALIAPKGLQQNFFSATHDNDSRYILGMFSPKFTLDAGESSVYNSKIYIGPENVEVLDSLSKGLGMTIDYGFLWFLSEALMWLLRNIYAFVGNWGVAIILTTFVVKLVFYNFSNKSFRSMARMSALAPQIKQIQEQYKDDKAKLQQEIMAFYSKEKLNPMSGCFPMLIQLPFFIALYWMLIESVELRQAPFIGWVQDLSAKDPLYILPVVMGASMLAQQLMSDSSSQDASQRQMMLMVPIIFTFVFMNFPAGLVLYMLTNNILSMAQQSFVKYQMNKRNG